MVDMSKLQRRDREEQPREQSFPKSDALKDRNTTSATTALWQIDTISNLDTAESPLSVAGLTSTSQSAGERQYPHNRLSRR